MAHTHVGLTSGGGSTYTYTARGTLTGKTTGGSTAMLSFDAFDRLVSDGTSTYGYDGLDWVGQRTAGGVTSSLLYDTASAGDNDLVAVVASGGTVTSKYGRSPVVACWGWGRVRRPGWG